MPKGRRTPKSRSRTPKHRNVETGEEWLHYIHAWQYADPADVAVSIDDMETYIVAKFREIFEGLSQGERHRLFFHDHFQEGSAEAVAQFEDDPFTGYLNDYGTREALKRVMGCGHFLLMLTFVLYTQTARRHKAEQKTFPTAEQWIRWKNSVEKHGLLRYERTTHCNPARNFKFIHNLYFDIFDEVLLEHYPTNTYVRENAVIPFKMLKDFEGPCGSADGSDEMKYNEFLVLLMHSLHEFGQMKSDNEANPYRDQYYRLIRKEGTEPPEEIPISMVLNKNFFNTDYERHEFNEVEYVAVKKRDENVLKIVQQTMSYLSRSQETRIRQEIVVRQNGFVKLTSSWQLSQYTFESHEWRQFSNTVMAKVIRQEWKLGCSGCPKKLQTKVTWTGRKRSCKWITVRRLILVRRVYWVKVRPIRRHQQRLQIQQG